jgi:hypothetical protein
MITNAKYLKNEDDKITSISAKINGVDSEVPMDKDNVHYAEILKQVEAKTLTIADAD